MTPWVDANPRCNQTSCKTFGTRNDHMHSESALIHQQAVTLFSQAGMQDSLRFELRHQAIIERFGRYPHRNAILGRASTPDELAFLSEPGSAF